MNLEPLRNRDGDLVNNWYIACLSSELKENCLIRRVIYDTPIVLFRSNGVISALVDKCLHRHVPLSEGFIENGEVRCPYHGWKFNSQGELTEIPSEGDTFLANKIKRCVKKFFIEEKDECIWIWMGEDKPSSPKPTWDFPEINNKKWAHYFMVTDFENEVTNLVENFMDVPHTVYVHKGWFRNKTFTKVPMNVKTFDGSVLVNYDQPNDGIGVLIKPLLNPKNEPMEHTDHFFYPNITRVDYRFGENYQYIINSQCTPVSTMNSRVYTYIGYKLPIIGKLIKPFIHFYTRKVINQDVDIMRIQSMNLKNDNRQNFQSTPADELHLQIERLRKMGESGNQELWNVTKDVTTDIWI